MTVYRPSWRTYVSAVAPARLTRAATTLDRVVLIAVLVALLPVSLPLVAGIAIYIGFTRVDVSDSGVHFRRIFSRRTIPRAGTRTLWVPSFHVFAGRYGYSRPTSVLYLRGQDDGRTLRLSATFWDIATLHEIAAAFTGEHLDAGATTRDIEELIKSHGSMFSWGKRHARAYRGARILIAVLIAIDAVVVVFAIVIRALG